ncbi:transcription initiation factor IIA subunit 2-like [Crassostrea virginica]
MKYNSRSKGKNRIQLKGKLNTYRFCDNVWTFVLNNVDFRDVQELAKCDKVKIVACDGKSASGHE